MADKQVHLLSLFSLLILAPLAGAQRSSGVDPSNADLVKRTLAAEVRLAQDASHPMRYRLYKATPRLSSVKEIYETKDGSVARLVEINGRPLNQADEKKEQARLDGLLQDPGRQRHRKQSEDQDASRALDVLRALPNAFLYEYSGTAVESTGRVVKFAFRPNPAFTPPNLETQVLTAMIGEIWIDPSQERITHLEGHLQQDVDFGWGILGRLNKGGWIVLEQADVGNGQWRIVRFQMSMSGRVLFKNRVFDTVEKETQFEPLPVGMSYVDAIRDLRFGTSPGGR